MKTKLTREEYFDLYDHAHNLLWVSRATSIEFKGIKVAFDMTWEEGVNITIDCVEGSVSTTTDPNLSFWFEQYLSAADYLSDSDLVMERIYDSEVYSKFLEEIDSFCNYINSLEEKHDFDADILLRMVENDPENKKPNLKPKEMPWEE